MYYFYELCLSVKWVLWDLSQVEEGDREMRICAVRPSFLPRVEELHISDLSIA